MALLFSLIGLAVGAGLGYAAAHKAHGLLLPLDEVEWVVREGSDWVSPDGRPISVAVLWGDFGGTRQPVRTVAWSNCLLGLSCQIMHTRATITA
jgi:hypothetical protein